MNFALRTSIFISVILFLSSCGKKEDLSLYLPNAPKNLVQIDLPSLKSKAITWESMKEMFSNLGSGSADYSIDLDRKAYLFADDIQNPVLLIPIDSKDDFEKAVVGNSKETVQTINGFSFIKTNFQHQKVTLAWKEGIAVCCKSPEQLAKLKTSSTSCETLKKLGNKDIEGVFNYTFSNQLKSEIYSSITFGDGRIDVNIKADDNLKPFIEHATLSSLDANNLAFENTNALLSIGANVNPTLLQQYLSPILPFLSQYNLITQNQFQELSPYFDGRIYFNLKKEQANPVAKLAFGVKKSTDTTLNAIFKTWKYDTQTQFHQLNNQYVYKTFDYLLFSNSPDIVTKSETSPDLLSIQLDKNLLNESVFDLPKLMFNSRWVSSFPFEKIDLNLKEEQNQLNLRLTLNSSNKELNSLLAFSKWLKSLENDEI
jgi:hypothetical protein